MNIRIFEFLSKSTGNYISIWSQKQGYIFNGMDNEVPTEIQSIIDKRINDIVNNKAIQAVLIRMKQDGLSDKQIQKFVIDSAIATLYGQN